MRLTEKIKDSKGEERVFTKYVKDNQKLKDEKLCKIEDIEDKIGIEIVDFFKLRDAKKLYLLRVKGYAEIIGIDMGTMEIHVDRKRGCPKNYNLKIRNFGKTWLFEKPKR